MVIAGALAGLAGIAQVPAPKGAHPGGVAASIGFDAITVALLGRSKPWGTFCAGLLFGALRAGGVTMQTNTGISIDMVLVLQSLIVLFIAAPAAGEGDLPAAEPRATATRGTAGTHAGGVKSGGAA